MHAVIAGFSGAILGFLWVLILWETILRDRVQRWKLERDLARELNAIFRAARRK